MALTILVLSLSAGTFFFVQQTIVGVKPEYTLGDKLFFDAIAIGGTRPCKATIDVNEPSGTFIVAEESLLDKSCVGSPCGSFSFRPVDTGSHSIIVTYSCQSGTPSPDRKDFNVIELKKECSDSDGNNIKKKGTISWLSGLSRKEQTDFCASSSKVREYTCDGNIGVWNEINCPRGFECSAGACIEEQVTVNPKAYKKCYNNDIYWYNSEDNRGDRFEDCSSNICEDAECVEPIVEPPLTCKEGEIRNMHCQSGSLLYERCTDDTWKGIVEICDLKEEGFCDEESLQCDIEIDDEEEAKCTTSKQCRDENKMCDIGCIEGTCTEISFDRHPCEEAVFEGYPTCEYDTSECTSCDITKEDCGENKIFDEENCKCVDEEEFDFTEFLKTYGGGIAIGIIILILIIVSIVQYRKNKNG